MIKPERIQTDDGSDTLYLAGISEHYHSTFGAIQESRHVFIESGLKNCPKSTLTIFEVGFGTGLNAYLTLLEALSSKQKINYITVEKYPLDAEIWESLNYPSLISEGSVDLFQAIHRSAWNEKVRINDYLTIMKLSSDIADLDYSKLPAFDLIYFDAFSPDKQPELWAKPILNQIKRHCNQNGIFVTYCAKGEVRRNLVAVGFIVERLPGPPGKREMLRATKRI